MDKLEPERWRKAVEEGDAGTLLHLFKARCGSCMGGRWVDFQPAYLKAMRNAALREPAEPARVLLNEILAFQGLLLCRVQQHIEDEILRASRYDNPHNRGLPASITDEWLPRASRLQQEIKDTCRALASVEHTYKLAERKAGSVQDGQETAPGTGLDSLPPAESVHVA